MYTPEYNENFKKQQAINDGFLNLGASAIIQALYFPSNLNKKPKNSQLLAKADFINGKMFEMITDCIFHNKPNIDIELLRAKCLNVLERNYLQAHSNSHFRKKVKAVALQKNKVVRILENL